MGDILARTISIVEVAFNIVLYIMIEKYLDLLVGNENL